MPASAPAAAPVVTLVDLNDGQPNHGVPALTALIEAAGARPVRVSPRDQGDLRLDGAAVILSGGHGSPLEPAPWRRRLQAVLPKAAATRPVLGICLGFQLLALAHGWTLRRLPRKRMGLYRLPAWQDDSPVGGTILERRSWGAVAAPGCRGIPLAVRSGGDVLALRLSPLSLGVAFHPEASPDAASRWLSHPDTAAALDALHGAGSASEQVRRTPALAATWAGVVPAFLARAVARHTARSQP